jgi:WD40 repeat protein
MPDPMTCPICEYAIQAGQVECTNCGAIFTKVEKAVIEMPASLKDTSSLKDVKSERKLPVWMSVRDLLASGLVYENDNRTADALELYYQALEMSAGHRRENPVMGEVILDILGRIEKLEDASSSPVAQVTVSKSGLLGSDESSLEMNADDTFVMEKEPQPTYTPKTAIADIPPVFPVEKVRSTEIIPENVDSLVLKESWEGNKGEINQISYSPEGSCLAVTTGKEACLIKASYIQDYQILSGHLNSIYSLGFSPDGRTLATGSADWDIKLWQTGDGSLTHTLEGHTEEVFSVAFSPDGQFLASGSADNSVRLWGAKDGHLLHLLNQHKDCVESVTFSPDGRLLASASDDGTICLWKIKDQGPGITWRAHKTSIAALSFSPRSLVLASSSDDGLINLWKPSSGSLFTSLKRNGSSVESVAFSPNGLLLASGAGDGTVCIWQISNGVLLCTLEHADSVTSVAFSPNGSRLAVANQNGVVCFWEIEL